MIKVWLARDEYGDLSLIFFEPPTGEFGRWVSPVGNTIWLKNNHPWGNDLIWENSPKEIEIVDSKQAAESQLAVAVLAKQDSAEEQEEAIRWLQEDLKKADTTIASLNQQLEDANGSIKALQDAVLLLTGEE